MEATLYKIEEQRVRCLACARRCLLSEGQTGFCGVRTNRAGKLHLDVHGFIAASHIDPIEKKPLLHFYPGSSVFSFSTTGCSWMCMYCQNYDISQRRRVEGFEISPEDIVNYARYQKVEGIAYTYNEPTIFSEFAHDVGSIAKKFDLFNIFVTNGYWTEEQVEYASTFLDAVTVDFKGNGNKGFLRRYVGADGPDAIFNTLRMLKEKGIHIEVTDLIIPEIGANLEDARVLLKFVYDQLGDETPVHFLRYHPDYKLRIRETPVELLEAHARLAKEMGLKYVYIGNVPGHRMESTFCPSCGKEVVSRYGFSITNWNLTEDNRCKYCGYRINIKGRLSEEAFQNRFRSAIPF